MNAGFSFALWVVAHRGLWTIAMIAHLGRTRHRYLSDPDRRKTDRSETALRGNQDRDRNPDRRPPAHPITRRRR
jgi:hypothetical protein